MSLSRYSVSVILSAVVAAGFALGANPAALAQDSVPAKVAAAPASPAGAAQVADSCASWDSCAKELSQQVERARREWQAERPKIEAEIERERQASGIETAKLRLLAEQFRENQGQYRQEIAQAARDAARAAQQLSGQGQKSAIYTERAQALRPFVQANSDEGWLGVEIGEVTAQKAKDLKLSSERGVVVSGVEQNSPAAKAGLKKNDVILQYNGENVEGAEQFRRLVRETPPDRTITLAVSRDGKTRNLSVKLEDRAHAERQNLQALSGSLRNLQLALPNQEWSRNFAAPDLFLFSTRTPVLGITAEDLSGQLGTYFGAPDGQGVLVRDVRSASPAEKAGLKAGDVIISANGKPVHSLSDLRGDLPARDTKSATTLALGLIRKGAQMKISVTIEPPSTPEPTRPTRTAQL